MWRDSSVPRIKQQGATVLTLPAPPTPGTMSLQRSVAAQGPGTCRDQVAEESHPDASFMSWVTVGAPKPQFTHL